MQAFPLHGPLLVSLLAAATSLSGGDQVDRPNILFILADDLGYGDLGCYGREDIRTPHLDRLADEGVRFTQHYANGPECTPTRTAFMTGRYPHRVGGLECAIGTGNVGRYDDAIRLREQNELGLPTQAQTIVRLVKQSGYATALTGKWHLGYEPKFAPHLHGFDEAFYCIGGGMDYFHYLDNVAGYNLFRTGQPIRAEGYFTDLATDAAVTFIRRHQKVPFFLYVPYTAPHSPFQGPHDPRPHPLPLDSPLWNQGQAPPAVYRAMIERMDSGIGRILETLSDCHLDRDTVVFFASDNGGTRSARNAPFSGIKGSTYEGGIRVPALIRWPGKIPQGTVSSQVCATFDFTSSIAQLAGVQLAAEEPLDGIDILRHVTEERPDFQRTLFWRKPRGTTLWRGVRDGRMKYVDVTRGDARETHLFDLEADPAEQSDLRDARPEELERLRQLYADWEQEVRAHRRGQP